MKIVKLEATVPISTELFHGLNTEWGKYDCQYKFDELKDLILIKFKEFLDNVPGEHFFNIEDIEQPNLRLKCSLNILNDAELLYLKIISEKQISHVESYFRNILENIEIKIER